MKQNIRITVIFFIILSALSCSGNKKSGPRTRRYPEMSIPALYTTPQERAEYAAQHFWDALLTPGYDCDSMTVEGVAVSDIESAFANFSVLLSSLDRSKAMKGMDSFFTRLESFQKSNPSSNAFEILTVMAEKYLYDPNSPYRDEDLYGVLAGWMSKSELIDTDLRPSYEFTARMCAKNAEGSMATNFDFMDLKSVSRSLYSIKADVTLLFFSNPGCNACKDIIEDLQSMPIVNSMLSSGRMAVVNIYIDEDVEAWKSYQSYYPETWYNGYDKSLSIRNDLKYHVRAIPSLYLLDKDKKVILKDAPQQRVYSLLQNLGNGF